MHTGTNKTLTEDDYKDVLEAVYPAMGKWWWIGLELGLNQEELERIKTKCANNIDECLAEMIRKWLKTRSLNPNWLTLVDALKHRIVGEEGVAADVKKKFVKVECEEKENTDAGPSMNTR